MSEERLVPKLRFSGFDGNWTERKLGELVVITSGKSPKDLVKSEGKFPYFKVEQLNYCNKFLVETPYFLDDDSLLIEKGSLIFPKRGMAIMANKIRILSQKSFMDTNLMTLTPESDELNNEFLFYFLTNEELSRLADTTSVPQLNNKHINPYPIKIPQLEEQLKISKFLSCIDIKIELLEKKYQYYKDFKKYLMQQIFAQKLRFNFTDEWEKYLLGDISLIGKGFTPSTNNPSFWDGDLKWLSIADMNQGKYINRTTKQITFEGSKNKEPVKKGTLLMSFKLSIGKLGILTEDMYTNEAICNFKWKNKDVLTEYMYYYLSSINILKYGSQAAKGITLNNETLSTIPVLLPSLEEQKKIINILSGVDLKINMLENSINDTSKFKKGLLQQMFV